MWLGQAEVSTGTKQSCTWGLVLQLEQGPGAGHPQGTCRAPPGHPQGSQRVWPPRPPRRGHPMVYRSRPARRRCWACPSPWSHSFCHIFRGLFFISAATSGSGGATERPAWGSGPAPPGPERLPHRHQPPQRGGTGPLPVPSATPVPPQCHRPLRSAGGEQGHASHPGSTGGAGGRLGQGGVLFCFLFSRNAPRVCGANAGAWQGNYFPSGQSVACRTRGSQVNNTFFFKLFKCQH